MSVDILGTSCDQCWSMVQYSFTSTETRTLVRMDSPGRPPRLSHSSWTMNSQADDDEVMLNVLRCQLTYYGQVVTNAEARFNIALRPRKPEGSLGQPAQDGHLDSHTAPELWFTGLGRPMPKVKVTMDCTLVCVYMAWMVEVCWNVRKCVFCQACTIVRE